MSNYYLDLSTEHVLPPTGLLLPLVRTIILYNNILRLGTALLTTFNVHLTFYIYILRLYICLCVCVCVYTQGVTGGMCQTSGECSLGQTIPI